MNQTSCATELLFSCVTRCQWLCWFFFQKRGAAEGEEEDRLSDEIIFSAEPEELEEEEVLEALELAEVEEGNLLCIGSF